MPAPANSVKNVIRGFLEGGEIWETSFWQVGITPPGVDGADGYATALGGILAADLYPSHRAILGANDGWSELRCYFYPAGGSVASYIGVHPFALSAPASGRQLPLQVACAVTLETGLAGRRNRGRMFFPYGTPGTVGGLLTTSVTTALASALATTFTDANTNTTDEGNVSVVSLTGTSSNPVTAVRVDNRPDVQRRRANKQTHAILATDSVTLRT